MRNFRNIEAADVELDFGVNILKGGNAQGKTNFLESVYFCSTGRSHRAGRDLDLIMLATGSSDASGANKATKAASGAMRANIRIINQAHSCAATNEISMDITKNGKLCSINGLPIRKLGELYGRQPVVIFSPEDLHLVKAGPLNRRRFLDMELCQLYPAYYHDIKAYHKVLKQRNNLLKELQKDKSLMPTLDIWDMQLAEYGTKIIKARAAFVERLGHIAAINHKDITNGNERLEIIYKSNVKSGGVNEFLERLLRARGADIALKTTSVGVHKDDLDFSINGKGGRSFASQGQQRTAVLAVKFAEIEITKQERGHPPVLLLDDVLSELDKSRQGYLLDNIKGLQAIITLTGAEAAVDSPFSNGAKVFEVNGGVIEQDSP